jgi:hypothetical protein
MKSSKIRLDIKRILAAFLVLHLMGVSVQLLAKKRRGTDLVIQKKGSEEITGELITVKQNALLLKIRQSEIDTTVAVDDIQSIKIIKKSAALEGIWGGFLIGCVGGSLVTYYRHRGTEREKGRDTLVIGSIVGLIGSLTGAVIGGMKGRDEIVQVEGLSANEKTAFLKKLSSKARIRNFE